MIDDEELRLTVQTADVFNAMTTMADHTGVPLCVVVDAGGREGNNVRGRPIMVVMCGSIAAALLPHLQETLRQAFDKAGFTQPLNLKLMDLKGPVAKDSTAPRRFRGKR